MTVKILIGDCRDVLRGLPDESVHCVVTSPPYFGLRDYGVAGQIGLEPTPTEFVEQMVAVFRDVRRVLRSDGTLWLNLGDSYAGSGKGGNPADSPHQKQATNAGSLTVRGKRMERGSGRWGGGNLPSFDGIKPKDLIGIPWRTALALQADGWWLRQDIIWSKPNPMPESVLDRCTKAHEYLFMLTKSARYAYNAAAIAEAAIYSGLANQSESGFKNPQSFNGKHKDGYRSSVRAKDGNDAARKPGSRPHSLSAFEASNNREYATRNKRSVWSVATKPFPGAHFATFPPDLIEPCIKAGCPVGGTVMDPFGGAGTTGMVAAQLGRDAILIELNPEYADMAERRLHSDAGMFASVIND